MAQRISRRDLAAYVGNGVLEGNARVIDELAAFLIETKRTREISLIVRDVHSYLAEHGVLVADIFSAHKLTPEAEKTIRDFLHSTGSYDTITLKTNQDSSLIGGVKINTPDATLDASIKHSLNRLRAQKQ